MFNARKWFAAAACVAASVATANAADLRFHHFLTPQSMPAAKVMTPWAEAVEAASNGAIEITIYPRMQLGGAPPQISDQVRNGIVDLGWVLPGYTPGRFPRLEVFELPSVYNGDPMSTSLAIADMTDGALADDYGRNRVKPVLQIVHAGNLMHCKDKPIRTLADFKGLKIRTPSRTGQYMLEALGATPVGMPVPAIPEALSKGVIDCAAIPWEIAAALKVHELANYHTLLADEKRFGTAVIFTLMNPRSYDRLDTDGKAAIDALSGRASSEMAAKQFIAGEDPGRQEAVEHGNEIIVLSAEETEAFNSLMKEVEARWIDEAKDAGFDPVALIDEAKTAIAANVGKD
ncbi:TRAP transporter substrate-binding protein [Mameliella alba]|nr:TRAP transporter substrate-binding protein [Mameliella alba]